MIVLDLDTYGFGCRKKAQVSKNLGLRSLIEKKCIGLFVQSKVLC